MPTQLGRLLSTHQGRFSACGWQWYLAGIFVLAAFGNLAKGEWILALVSLVLGGLTALYCLYFWRQTLQIFEGGFVWQRLFGALNVAKEDISRVELITHTRRGGSYQEVVVTQKDGQDLHFEGLTDLEQIRNYLNAWTNPQVGTMNVAAGPAGWSPPGQGAAAPGGWSPPGQGAAAPGGWSPPGQGAAAPGGWSPPGQGAPGPVAGGPVQPGWSPTGQGWNGRQGGGRP